MFFTHNMRTYFASLALALLILAVGVSSLQAQTKQMLQWSSDLNYLKNASADELVANRAAIVQIRNGVDLWLKMHPDSEIELQPAPPEPWNADQLRDQVSALSQAMRSYPERGS